jgi:glutamate dehydrogenase/leucine dehydrogenase
MIMSHRTQDGCEVYTVTRRGQEIGYVVIDSVVGGRSCGGLRMMPDVSLAEVRGLARSMTLKFAITGLSQGGAKAGVRGDPEAPPDQRQKLLRDFCRAILSLVADRTFVPCADMGTTATEIREVLTELGINLGRRELQANSSGDYTAASVCAGAQAATRHLGLDLAKCRVAIEGFGKVGSVLCRLLSQAGANVVAISTSRGAIYNPGGLDADLLEALARRDGSRIVQTYQPARHLPKESLLALPVELLCPCARHDALDTFNAPAVAARIVCPGANNPVTPEALALLESRGVLVLPDFVTNCGGVLGGTMEFASVPGDRIMDFVRRHVDTLMAGILTEASGEGISPTAVATGRAMQRLEAMRLCARNTGLSARVFACGLELYRRGIMPSFVAAPLAPWYFRRRLGL